MIPNPPYLPYFLSRFVAQSNNDGFGFYLLYAVLKIQQWHYSLLKKIKQQAFLKFLLNLNKPLYKHSHYWKILSSRVIHKPSPRQLAQAHNKTNRTNHLKLT